MSCEDCKNYEKKKPAINELQNSVHFSALMAECRKVNCNECCLGPDTDACPVYKVWMRF